MWVTAYIVFMAVLLLGCSAWAAWKKDRGMEATFAGGAILIAILRGGTLCCFYPSHAEISSILIVGTLLFVGVCLICHSLVGVFNEE